ncbi:hypothetical protein ABW20_dc0100504 [Dactylellina cionopaga]|nr:hypothetical protein ABW20_dc0100504 [Dactylellina cionopaga]
MQRQKHEFETKKRNILSALATGDDASPKGNVDSHILPVMDLLNGYDGVVTTSSCSGRVSVFLEGKKKSLGAQQLDHTTEEYSAEVEKVATIGGKGGGGKWLFVTHDVLPEELVAGDGDDTAFLTTLFGGLPSEPVCQFAIDAKPSAETRYVHFKFEPMILHILTENLEIANRVLTCAITSSFRESGIVSPLKNPVVAIRTTGLAFDAPIGIYDSSNGVIKRFIEPPGLRTLARLANARFKENFGRISSFSMQLMSTAAVPETREESRQTRADRKRREGLEKKKSTTANRGNLGTPRQDPLDGGIQF